MKTKLSIIVPCYNSGHLLVENIKNMMKVIDDSIEFVIVDDCSTDDSFDYLKAFSSEYPALKIVLRQNSQNLGPGPSRNRGIVDSSGEYVTFLDADDYFENSIIKTFFKHYEDKPDCIAFDFRMVSNNKTTDKSMFYKPINQTGLINKKTAMVLMRGCTCGKIYRRSIIVDNNIEFLSLMSNEDIPFTRSVLSFCEKIVYVDKPLYNYIQNDNSLSHTKKYLSTDNAIQSFEYMISKIDFKYDKEIEAIYIHDVIYAVAFQTLREMKASDWKNNIRKIEETFPKYCKNKYLKIFPDWFRIVVFVIHNHLYWIARVMLSIKEKMI